MSDSRPQPVSPPGQWPDRYARQMLFTPVGDEGQRRLNDAHVLLVGCGALGSVIANLLTRAGVGHLRIVDRDVLDATNLHRQVLFDEADLAADLPKAEAARRKLVAINSDVHIEAVVADANPDNIRELAEGADLLLDGTDNFETRYLLNDLAVATSRPWIYGACVGATGLSLVVLPGETPCLRCIFEEAPPPEATGTCDTVGILGPVPSLVASHQALEAMKILMGRLDAVDRRLWSFDAWANHWSRVDVGKARQTNDCPCCVGRRFEYLEGRHATRTITLCGRNAVQIFPRRTGHIDFAQLADRLRPVARAEPRCNGFVFKALIDNYELTLFADGRALIRGTDRAEEAKAVYARYIGA